MVFLVSGVADWIGGCCDGIVASGRVWGGGGELWTVEGGKRQRLMWEERSREGEGRREDREVPCFLSMKNPASRRWRQHWRGHQLSCYILSQRVGSKHSLGRGECG